MYPLTASIRVMSGNTEHITARIQALRHEVPHGVELVAVSKFHPVNAVMAAYRGGQRLFGESRVQELTTKAPELPDDIRWHFIGHLQTNKVRAVVPLAAMIESVDSDRLLGKIDTEARRIDKCVDVLLQVHVAAEEQKFGWYPDELESFLNSVFAADGNLYKGVRFRGIMGMATNTDDKNRIIGDFRAIRDIYDKLKTRYGMLPQMADFDTVSMGMSGDWLMAVQCGSTMVRIGTAIFGPREY